MGVGCQYFGESGPQDVKMEKVAVVGSWGQAQERCQGRNGNDEKGRGESTTMWGFLIGGEVKIIEIERGTWGPEDFISQHAPRLLTS